MTAAFSDGIHDVDATAVLRLLPARPRLLALGEPTHGHDALLDVRNDLFRELVERFAFRTIAIESDCLRALVVDDYVTGGAGTLDEVMARGFSHEWFTVSAGNRELVRWMRAHNEGRPPAGQVRFAGADGPLEMEAAASPRQALTALHTFLAARVDAGLLPCDAGTLDELLGADEQWTEPAAMRDPSRSVGRTAPAGRLRLIADDLVLLLQTQAPRLVAGSTADEWDRARLFGRTALGLLRYHDAMADRSPARLARLLAVRASMMASNLLAAVSRGPVLVYAHNSHLQRDESSMRMGGAPARWWSAGALAAARLGADYAMLATAVGTLTARGVERPPPDTIEGRLYALPADRCLVDPRVLRADVVARVSPWFGYAPLDPAQLGRIDGIVFVKDA